MLRADFNFALGVLTRTGWKSIRLVKAVPAYSKLLLAVVISFLLQLDCERVPHGLICVLTWPWHVELERRDHVRSLLRLESGRTCHPHHATVHQALLARKPVLAGAELAANWFLRESSHI